MTFPWILAALAALAAVYIVFAIVVAKMIAQRSGEEFWPAFEIGLAYGLVPGLNIATFVAMKMADRDEKARSRCA